MRDGKPAGVLVGFADEDDWFEYRLQNDPQCRDPQDAATVLDREQRPNDPLAPANGRRQQDRSRPDRLEQVDHSERQRLGQIGPLPRGEAAVIDNVGECVGCVAERVRFSRLVQGNNLQGM